MKDEELKNYLKSAEIGKGIFNSLRIKPGMKVADIAEGIEKQIAEAGGLPAFPLNLSCNEFAAHDTASSGDDRIIGEDVLKVDVGVHIDGYIADSAVTIDLTEENGKLCEATKAALEDAVASVKAGISTAEIGAVIEQTIKKHGFKPVENLTGHLLAQYNLHAGVEVPNYAARSGEILEEGDVVAIEPFATNGIGRVVESQRCEIYSLMMGGNPRSTDARQMLKRIVEKYRQLPFAERWIAQSAGERIALRELVRSGSLMTYPVLKEKSGGMVSQAEHTVIVEKDSARVLL